MQLVGLEWPYPILFWWASSRQNTSPDVNEILVGTEELRPVTVLPMKTRDVLRCLSIDRPVYLSLNPRSAHFPRSFLKKLRNYDRPWTDFTCLSQIIASASFKNITNVDSKPTGKYSRPKLSAEILAQPTQRLKKNISLGNRTLVSDNTDPVQIFWTLTLGQLGVCFPFPSFLLLY